ncbi:MAG: hypothetical protein RBS10_16910, partial [Thauera propionica]|nr:hypothetical protein [Thauera propionica]
HKTRLRRWGGRAFRGSDLWSRRGLSGLLASVQIAIASKLAPTGNPAPARGQFTSPCHPSRTGATLITSPDAAK